MEQDVLLKAGKVLPLMEEFYSIQGEGFHTGKAAYFVRIGGCDVGCNWCDVKDSWSSINHPFTQTDRIVEHVVENPSKSVVVTGGEPLLYNLDYLCHELKKKNIKTFLETSGSHQLSGEWSWICLSPKKQQAPLEEFYKNANELKVIISDKNDFDWAEENARFINKDCYLFLQPEWSKKEQVMPLIIDYILKHPRWQISIQSHKYMNIP